VALAARGDDDDVEMTTAGSVDVDGSAPMARDSMFRLTSITKPITAAAVLTPVEDGRIALDAPIDVDPIEEWNVPGRYGWVGGPGTFVRRPARLLGVRRYRSRRIVSPLISHDTPKATIATDSSQNTGWSSSTSTFPSRLSASTASTMQTTIRIPQTR